MAQYLILLYNDPSNWATMSPQEIQRAIEKFHAWGQKLRQKGVLLGSHKLADEPGQVLRASGGQVRVSDGPYSETKEVLGGYYLVEAATYDQAVATSRDCPNLEYGGTIEVREVDPMVNTAKA
jgi:hypothetical protein